MICCFKLNMYMFFLNKPPFFPFLTISLHDFIIFDFIIISEMKFEQAIYRQSRAFWDYKHFLFLH